MGWLERKSELVECYELHLTELDIAKQKSRMKNFVQWNIRPLMTRHEKQFLLRLEKCPICGRTPHFLKVRNRDKGCYEYKATCPEWHHDASEIGFGDWFCSVSRAGRDWNERVRREKLDRHGREIYGLLWVCRHQLTRQQIRTLKGQIFSGNADAALRGLNRILKGDLPYPETKVKVWE